MGNIIRTYKSKKQSDAITKAQEEAERDNLEIISMNWQDGKWGCLAFTIALLLCLLLFGILVFIYMLLVKPKGELTVTLKEKV